MVLPTLALSMTIAAGVLLAASLVLTLTDTTVPIDPAWAAVVISGLPLLYLALWRVVHNPGISKISSALLISVAMIAALAIGDLFAAGEVAFIMAIGAILEEKTTGRAQRGLKALISLSPQQGRRIRGGEEELIDAEKIEKGDRLRVLPGETIPVDGTIVSGNTSVDQAILTGESLPVDKMPGDPVFCGTINRFGVIELIADKVGEDSSHAAHCRSLGKLARTRRSFNRDRRLPCHRRHCARGHCPGGILSLRSGSCNSYRHYGGHWAGDKTRRNHQIR